MVFEMAQLEIKPGSETAFEEGVKKATPLFQRQRGCRAMKLLRTVEDPRRYLLMITWETLEDHTVHFRQSEDFKEWRRLVGDFFAAPPQVVHVAQSSVTGF